MSTEFPEHGTPWSDLEPRMREMGAGDVKWREGKTAIYIFNAGEELERVKKAAYAMFSEENGLGPAAFPSLARMEREVVAFGLRLLNAPKGAAGGMTSGGTDSIFMALKAARDYARNHFVARLAGSARQPHEARDDLDGERRVVRQHRAEQALATKFAQPASERVIVSVPQNKPSSGIWMWSVEGR